MCSSNVLLNITTSSKYIRQLKSFALWFN
jgi:hypothetical protein